MHKRWLFLPLCMVALSGCPGRECEGKVHVYEADDLLPENFMRAGDVMARVSTPQTIELTWTGTRDSRKDIFPGFSYVGVERLDVQIEHDGSAFTSEYDDSYDPERDECFGESAPRTPVRVHIRSESGLIDERFDAELSVQWDGTLDVSAELAKLQGGLSEYQELVDESHRYRRTFTELFVSFTAEGSLDYVSAHLVGVDRETSYEHKVSLFAAEPQKPGATP